MSMNATPRIGDSLGYVTLVRDEDDETWTLDTIQPTMLEAMDRVKFWEEDGYWDYSVAAQLIVAIP